MRAGQADALMLFGSALHFPHLQRIADLALQHRLAAMTWERAFAEGGLLMTYGPDEFANFRLAAYYVDKILKGTRPADLPVGQPTKLALSQHSCHQPQSRCAWSLTIKGLVEW